MFRNVYINKGNKLSVNKNTLMHAALIEELLDEEYRYIFTSRFQSDPLERRFGQYRQMKRRRF